MTVFKHKFKFWEDRNGRESRDQEIMVVLENISYISSLSIADCVFVHFMHMNDGSAGQLDEEEYETIMNLMLQKGR